MVEYVMIAVHDTTKRQFAQAVKQCRRLGMNVTQELPELGTFSGFVEAGQITKIRRVHGVEAVEPIHFFQVAPPEYAVQ